jgi:hypothetical protein
MQYTSCLGNCIGRVSSSEQVLWWAVRWLNDDVEERREEREEM